MSRARLCLILLTSLCLAGCGATSSPHAFGDASSTAEAGLPPLAGNAWLEIDVGAFEDNVRTLQARLAGKSAICAALKANAYGHGIHLVLPSLIRLGVPCVGIASNDEARLVRTLGFKGRLMRLRSATVDELEDGLRYGLEELAGNLAYARSISELGGKHSRTVPIHLVLDAGGMSRNGIELVTEQGRRAVLELLRLPHLRLVGLMTHFPREDREDALRVLATFKEQADWLIAQARLDRSKLTLHCANSYATREVPESHLDMVRVGALLYGDNVMSFKSRVATVNSYPAGSTVGYEREFVLKRDSRLANIPAGYSDGYGRMFSNRGHVLIRGQRYPVVGRISMNTFMVDVTDNPDIQLGDEVVLFGKQGTGEITKTEIQQRANTIILELYTLWGNANPRIPKR